MKLALNGATIMQSPIEDDVEIAAACGFDALEIWAGKLAAYTRDHALDELAARMRELDLPASCINSIEDITYRDAAGRRDLLRQLGDTVAIARSLYAPAIVVVPGSHPATFDRDGAVTDAVTVLRQMSDVAGEIQLAFEFLGKPRCAVPTLDMAAEIVHQVDRPNIGLVIDTFHFYAGGSSLADLDDVPVEKLTVVHINGCDDRPRGQLTDADRLYPGEGVIPIDSILSALRRRGYDGVASVEIFRPEYWAQDPQHVAWTAHARATAVLGRAGYVVA